MTAIPQSAAATVDITLLRSASRLLSAAADAFERTATENALEAVQAARVKVEHWCEEAYPDIDLTDDFYRAVAVMRLVEHAMETAPEIRSWQCSPIDNGLDLAAALLRRVIRKPAVQRIDASTVRSAASLVAGQPN